MKSPHRKIVAQVLKEIGLWPVPEPVVTAVTKEVDQEVELKALEIARGKVTPQVVAEMMVRCAGKRGPKTASKTRPETVETV